MKTLTEIETELYDLFFGYLMILSDYIRLLMSNMYYIYRHLIYQQLFVMLNQII